LQDAGTEEAARIGREKTPMSRTNIRQLIDHGRKAGLHTSQIYGALAATRPEGNDPGPGQTDENGFISAFDNGNRIFRPQGSQNRGS
jgi:hypothetical protein